MKQLKKIWMLNYDSINMTSDEINQIIMSLSDFPNELQCEAIDRLMVYCDKISVDAKANLKRIISNLWQCKCCNFCCKKSLFQHSLAILNMGNAQFYGIEDYSNVEKVGVIVPDYLSANSFLQPPIDMLNAITIFGEYDIEYKFIDNRVKHFNFFQIGNHFKDCKYILLTTTPYDHIQNYFIDYRLKFTFLLVNYLKKCFPDKIVILCGAHGTVRLDLVERECLCDIIIRGEYDFIAPDYIYALMNKRRYEGNNVYYCRRNGNENWSNINLSYRNNINIIPDYSNINLKDYYGDVYKNNLLEKVPEYAAILASRGCYNRCSYCYNFWGNNVRYRDEINVVDEMEMLESAGAKGVFFIDSTFTQNKEWTSRICKEIKRRKLRIVWSAETRTDCVDRELLQDMKAANCTALWFGVESYCDQVLEVNHKKNKCGTSIDALAACREIGIQPQQFIMIGAPGETKESINKTLSFLMDVDSTFTESVMVTTPRFGSKLYELAKLQFPKLGNDFYSLNGVKGLVGNDLTADILYRVRKMSQNRQLQFV